MLGALSSSLYKDNTFSRKIQIVLTLRNALRNVKMQRFAADGVGHVLYYEGGISKRCMWGRRLLIALNHGARNR